MGRGGFRAGSGRPKKGRSEPARKPERDQSSSKAKAADPPPSEPRDKRSPELKASTPLDYMLAVMADPDADANRRDRMAVAAAPFMHPKAGEAGKKQEAADRAKKALGGRFSPAPPPPEAKAH